MKPVLILYPPYEGKSYLKSRSPFPIGPLYIAAYLESKGIPAVVKDFSYPPAKSKTVRPKELKTGQTQYWRWGWTNEEIKKWFEEKGKNYYDVIGVSSLMSSNYTGGYHLIRIIKEVIPNSTIVVGGPHATAAPDHVLKHTDADYICIGEGEEIFYHFLMGKKKFTRAGYAVKDKIFVKEKKGIQFIEDMNSLPFPRRKLLMDSRAIKELFVTFSRGCPHKCSFCGSHLIQGRRWRVKSVDRIVEELRFYVQRWNVKSFIVEDDNVTPGIKGVRHWKAVCRKILEDKDLPKLKFHVSHGLPVYATADEELCELLYAVGFRKMAFPLESTNAATLKDMRKEFTPTNWRKSIKAWRFEKNVPAQIILGYPFVDTIETMLKTMIDISRMKGRVWASHFRLNRGTELFDRCVDAGIVPKEYDPINTQAFYIETERFNIKDLRELMQISRGINYGTERGADVFTCDIGEEIFGKAFNHFKSPRKIGDVVARGGFAFKRAQNIFATILLMRTGNYKGRPHVVFEGTDQLVYKGVNESRVWHTLAKMLKKNRYIKRL